MIFKKKGMVDIRELQKRGVVRIPKNDVEIPTNKEGFVELQNNSALETEKSNPSSNSELFGFIDSPSSTENFSTETGGYNKREVDQKISDLDNKVYKLENRIELLEKKLDVNQPSEPSVGVMGW